MSSATRIAAFALAALPLCGQETPPPAAPAKPGFIALSYPKDKDFVVAEVNGKSYTLERLAEYIEGRQAPGFREYLATDDGQRMLRSDLIAPWVRHFADIMALINVTRDRGFDPKQADAALSAALKRTFESYLADYVAQRRASLRKGDPEPKLSQPQIDSLRRDFQLRYGLDTEVQGYLDYLIPDDYSEAQLRDFFTANARMFGGMVTFAHILVRNRDDGTGILLDDAGQGQARARIAEIKARLLPDGSNFREVARRCSEDLRTAADGGVLNNVTRFDKRLPAILSRTAWQLADGETSEVVETPYGFHLLQRIGFDQRQFLMFSTDMLPQVRQTMQMRDQEDLLFEARKQYHLTLHL